jgi:hypothetical protein
MSQPSRPSRALSLAACLIPVLLAGCTVGFTPGDAKPAVYTPYPSGAASGSSGTQEGQGMRGGPGTPP